MPAKQYCLLGYPLGHSISPQIHRRLFELRGVDGVYALRSVPPGRFGAEAEKCRALDGFNVTIPYKQKILPYLGRLSPKAEKYGAVNTVKTENGVLCGYNTDAEGFLRALEQVGIALAGDVLLCGAGGAAAMMACEALEHGCRLYVAARNPVKAKAFIENLKQKYKGAFAAAVPPGGAQGTYDVILNATPAGMSPHSGEKPLPDGVASRAGAVFDAIYNPSETLLMKEARAAGAKVQGGLPMLVWQAAAAQGIWTGASFGEDEILGLCGEMEKLL